jgi:hypothetical protein
MSDDDHERRLSTVEANFGNMAQSMGKIEGLLGDLFNRTGDIKTNVALVVQNQEGMNIYQRRCDEERADHEKRITECENFKKTIRNYSIAIFGTGSLISPQISKLWERFMS